MSNVQETLRRNKMSLVFIICSVLVTLCQIQYSFGQQQNQDPVDKGMAAANVDLNLNVAPEAEIPTTEANMPDALNETDIVLITNNTNETIAVSNNGTADEEYEDEDGGSLTTDIPDLSTPSSEVPPPSWAPGGNPQIDLRLEDFCLCDLKIGFCDVNCCCDEDCDSEDRKVFSHCQERPHPVLDSKYCFQEHLIFSNNTEYSVEYTHSGAFCIITDNLPQRTTYQLVKGATNLEEYKSLQKKRRYYSWMSNQKEKPATLDPYSDGTLVWGVDENGVTFPLGIPVSVVGSECESVTSAVYLKDVESSCNQMLHNLGSECESNMYLDAVEYLAFYVIADPRNLFQQNRSTETTTEPTTTVESTGEESSGDIGNDASVEMSPQFPNKTNEEEEESAKNLTNVQSERQLRRLISLGDSIEKLSDLSDIHPDQLVSIRTYLCQLESKEEVKEDEEKKKGREEGRRNEMYKATGETDEICVEKNIIDIPQPIYNSGVCSNVLLSIDYTFIHNGSEGLFDIQAKVYLTSVPDVSTHTKQRFSIKYLWASTEEKTVFERSGRPGYITGKPLLMGKLIENRTEDDVVKEAINLDTDPRHWMTILSPGSTGKCDSFSQVTFGVDMRSGCSFEVTQEDFTQDCNLVQERILRLLLGPIPLNGERLRIASFGDSSVNNPPDWVPILVPEEPHCGTSSKLFGITRHYDLITSLHIEVAYSLQGSLGNPQPKVVGVALRYGESRETRFPCSNTVCQLNSKMTTSEVELMSSVSFVDVTRPPLPAYSQPPALDLKLPYDFFYPFLPSSASSCLQMYCIKLCVATSLLVLYSFYAVPTLVSFSLA